MLKSTAHPICPFLGDVHTLRLSFESLPILIHCYLYCNTTVHMSAYSKETVSSLQMERTAKPAGPPPPPAYEPSRKRGKSGESHAVMSVAAMELNEDLVEGPSRPTRADKHHKHEGRHDKAEEKHGRGRDHDDGDHERRKQEKRSHGRKRRHD